MSKEKKPPVPGLGVTASMHSRPVPTLALHRDSTRARTANRKQVQAKIFKKENIETVNPSTVCSDPDYLRIARERRNQTAESILEKFIDADCVPIPESTLQALLGLSCRELTLEVSQLADENGWKATCTPDRRWLFQRKKGA